MIFDNLLRVLAAIFGATAVGFTIGLPDTGLPGIFAIAAAGCVIGIFIHYLGTHERTN